jgi:hypothetical protein
MPWLAKALLLALKTKRGRELLFAAGVGAIDIARSERARELYARAWEVAADPRPRRSAAGLVRNAARRVEDGRRRLGDAPTGAWRRARRFSSDPSWPTRRARARR